MFSRSLKGFNAFSKQIKSHLLVSNFICYPQSYSRFGISSSSESSFSSSSKSSKFGFEAAPEFKFANISCMLPKPPASPPSSAKKIKSHQSYSVILINKKNWYLPSSLSDSSSRHLLKSAFKK